MPPPAQLPGAQLAYPAARRGEEQAVCLGMGLSQTMGKQKQLYTAKTKGSRLPWNKSICRNSDPG